MKTVVSLFNAQSEAENAIRALQGNGFSEDQISLVTQPAQSGHVKLPDALNQDSSKNVDKDVTSGSVAGAAIGGGGGLLAGLAALLIPGIGPVLAVGPLVVALSGISGAGAGAIAGASAGGFLGALQQTGMTTEQANSYMEGLRNGKSLVAVHVEDDDVERVTKILQAQSSQPTDENPSGTAVLPSHD